MTELAPRKKNNSLLLGALAALAAAGTLACGTSYFEIPIETPIQPKLDVTPFQRVLIAGFVAGGKTGTTEDWGDAWFAGITTNASTVVWVGYPNAKIPMTNVHGIRVVGGTFPATIWRLFMQGAFGRHPPGDWPPPRDPVMWKPFHGQYEFFGAPPAPVAPTETGKKNGKPTKTTTTPPPTTTGPAPGTTTT